MEAARYRARVCAGCGVIAPSSLPSCARCGSACSAAGVHEVIDREDGKVWGSYAQSVACDACGLTFPLDRFPAGGTVRCARGGAPRGYSGAG